MTPRQNDKGLRQRLRWRRPDKRSYTTFIGTFRVKLCDLQLSSGSNDRATLERDLDISKVASLMRSFETQTCRRELAKNRLRAFIPAKPDSYCHDRPRRQHCFPVWRGGVLFYKDGRHRLEATRRYFQHKADQWWLVDVSVRDIWDGLSESTLHELCAASQQGVVRQEELLAELEVNARKNLQRIRSLGSSVTTILDKFTPYKSLLEPLTQGHGPLLQGLHCEESLAHALGHVLSTWEFILAVEGCEPDHLDLGTIKALQGLCPARSQHDANCVKQLFRSRKVFQLVQDEVCREALLSQVLQIDTIIPSMHLLLENAKYIKPAAKVLLSLLRDDAADCPRETASMSLQSRFHAIRSPWTWVDMQTRISGSYHRVRCESPTQASQLAYLTLWLAVLRDLPALASASNLTNPRINRTGRGIMTESAIRHEGNWEQTLGDRRVLYFRLRQLCSRLGYDKLGPRNELEELQKAVVKAAINRAWPPRLYTLEPSVVATIAQIACDKLREVSSKPHTISRVALVTDDKQAAVVDKIEYRCGRPHELEFLNNRDALFLDAIYADVCTKACGLYITPFFCLRDIFLSFFGIPEGLEYLDILKY